jgi:hypothetical protein
MSPRSLLLLAVLFAASAAAQWNDTIVIHYYNASAVRMCALDAPTRCVYTIKPNMTLYDPNKTSIFWMYLRRDVNPPRWSYGGSVPNTALLQALYFYGGTKPPLRIKVPSAGYVYSNSFFYLDGQAPDRHEVCRTSYMHAVPVSAGEYTLSSFTPPVYFLEPNTCTSYVLADWIFNVVNMTAPWALVYVIYMPTARKALWRTTFNGTAHVYNVNIDGGTIGDLWPVGRGIYLANGTYLPTIATSAGYFLGMWPWYGPVPFANYSHVPSSHAVWFYNAGQSPSDGSVWLEPPLKMRELTFLTEGSAGYLVFDSPYAYVTQFSTISASWPPKRIIVYAQRYSLVEVALANSTHLYTVRTLACPAYTTPPLVVPAMPNTAKELELCNNRTDTLYVALYVNPRHYFAFIDRLDPGACRRVRYDGSLHSNDIIYLFYDSPRTLCRWAPSRTRDLFRVVGLAPWYRYYIFSNNTVKRGPPITPDADYYSVWLNITRLLVQQYNATINALLDVIRALINGSRTDATRALQNFIASQPRLVGTIRMDSSTSVWLRTTLNELQRFHVAGPPSGSFGPITSPTVPPALAPAAAAAVAVAWAASRRDDDVAASAAVAGVALALFGILMTLIYGAESLGLVALGVIVAAAAAAWRRIS